MNLLQDPAGKSVVGGEPFLGQKRRQRSHAQMQPRRLVPGMSRRPIEREQGAGQRVVNPHIQVRFGHGWQPALAP